MKTALANLVNRVTATDVAVGAAFVFLATLIGTHELPVDPWMATALALLVRAPGQRSN